MMDIPERFKPLFNNHNIHLLQLRDTVGYQFANEDNQDFFTLIQEFYQKGTLDISSFRKNHPDLNIYWETLAAFGAATGTAELVEYAWEHEGGRINMCTALENLKQEGHQEGRREGHQEGLQEGIKATIEILCDMGLEYDTILQKVQDKFHISKSEVEKYL